MRLWRKAEKTGRQKTSRYRGNERKRHSERKKRRGCRVEREIKRE